MKRVDETSFQIASVTKDLGDVEVQWYAWLGLYFK
jgi:hypothetical protein